MHASLYWTQQQQNKAVYYEVSLAPRTRPRTWTPSQNHQEGVWEDSCIAWEFCVVARTLGTWSRAVVSATKERIQGSTTCRPIIWSQSIYLLDNFTIYYIMQLPYIISCNFTIYYTKDHGPSYFGLLVQPCLALTSPGFLAWLHVAFTCTPSLPLLQPVVTFNTLQSCGSSTSIQ